jgi:predicted nucleic acid-binding Zn ribbon protein
MAFDTRHCFDVLIVCKDCRRYRYFNSDLTRVQIDGPFSCTDCLPTVFVQARVLFWSYTLLINRCLGYVGTLKGLRYDGLSFIELAGTPPSPITVEQIARNYVGHLLRREIVPVGFGIGELVMTCTECTKQLRFDYRALVALNEKAPLTCPECGARFTRTRTALNELFQFSTRYGTAAHHMDLAGFAVVPVSPEADELGHLREMLRPFVPS